MINVYADTDIQVDIDHIPVNSQAQAPGAMQMYSNVKQALKWTVVSAAS